MDKPSGLDYLLTALGLDWPDGDEYKMWDLADYWHNAATSLADIDADIDAAISAVQAAYPEGSGGDAMIEQLRSMRTGPQSIDQLVKWFNDVGDSASQTGDSIQSGKIQFETLLFTTAAALLAEEAFPPTAPAEQAATIAISRVGAQAAMRDLMSDIIENGLKDVVLTALKNQWQKLVLHLALDAVIPSGVDLANQEAKVLSGHQNGINWGEVGTVGVEGLAGGLMGGLAGGLMQGWMRNLSSGLVRGLASGVTGGLAGTLSSGLAGWALTGKLELNPSSFLAGGFWGAVGGGGAESDGSAPRPTSDLGDEAGVHTVGDSPPDLSAGASDNSVPHTDSTDSGVTDHSDYTGAGDSGPGRHTADTPGATHSADSEQSTEHSGVQDHSMSGWDGSVESRPTHEAWSSEDGPKVHAAGSDQARPVESRAGEVPSRGGSFGSGGERPGAGADSVAQPDSPISARSGGTAGDGARTSMASTRPQAIGDGSSAYRPSQPETDSVRSESTTTSSAGPSAVGIESSGNRSEPDPSSAASASADPVSADSASAGSVPADKPFSPSLDQPVSETSRADEVPGSDSRPMDDPEVTVPDDISGIDVTPTPLEPSMRAGLVDDGQRPADPGRPSSRIGDRPENSSPIRARSTETERGSRAGEADSRAGRSGRSDRPLEFAGARSRADDGSPPNEQHPLGDNESRPPEHPGGDPRSRAGVPESPRAGEAETHSSGRTSYEHGTGDHESPHAPLADADREYPGKQRDSTDQEHHPEGGSRQPEEPEESGSPERPRIEDAFRDHAELTAAGLALHKLDSALRRLAGLVPPDDRYFTVDAHVTADGFIRIGEHYYTPEEFGDMLREYGWDGEKPIRMIGCDAAENGVASRLANHLDTDVLAPTEKAWSDENGRVYTSTSEKDANGNPRPRIPPDGDWTTTHPDGTRTPASEDGFVPGTPEQAKHDLDSDSAHERQAPLPADSPQLRVMREQVERANNDPEYFKKYYKDRGNYTIRRSTGKPDETGFVPPHLVKDPTSHRWIAEQHAPAPLPAEYLEVHDPVGIEGMDREALDKLNDSAGDRRNAITADQAAEDDLKSARNALEMENTPENQEAVRQAAEAHSPLHRDMSEKSEKFGETVAAEHAIPDHYEGAEPVGLEGPANGNDQFDQVYRLPNGKFVVVECKSSVDTDLGARWTDDAVRVSQGHRKYFLDILEEMRGRGETYPHELVLADELEEALNNGDLDYILVQGQRNKGEYAGYVMKIFDISSRRAP